MVAMKKTRIEADVYDVDNRIETTFFVEMEITPEQVTSFNKGMKGFLVVGMNLFVLWKVWKEEHPDENLSPFVTEMQAQNMLIALWQFCGHEGRPEIQQKR